MKFISTFSVRTGCWQEAATRFPTGKGRPAEGVTLLGRWHNTGLSGVYSLVETDDPAAAYAFSLEWSDHSAGHCANRQSLSMGVQPAGKIGAGKVF